MARSSAGLELFSSNLQPQWNNSWAAATLSRDTTSAEIKLRRQHNLMNRQLASEHMKRTDPQPQPDSKGRLMWLSKHANITTSMQQAFLQLAGS